VDSISGVAVPFDYAKVDTDAMFPVSSEADAEQYGWGAALFGRGRADPRRRP
jgi:3-isopropylmalate dehydratase small subunit